MIAVEFKTLLKVMILEDGNISMPKLAIKDRGGLELSQGCMLVLLKLGGLIYRFNPRA